jgi:hypothetical protein
MANSESSRGLTSYLWSPNRRSMGIAALRIGRRGSRRYVIRQRLNRSQEVEEIRTRTRNAFATTYLTLLSIIQGVALAAFVAKVDSLLARGLFHVPQMLIGVGVFLTIVAVWNQYQMGVMVYSWTAQILDAIIPFAIGLCEFAMISGIERGPAAVLVANGLLLVFGLIAFEYQYFQVRRNAIAGAFVHELNHAFRATDAISTTIAAALAFATAWLEVRFASSITMEFVGASLVVAIPVGHLAREVLQWHTIQRRMGKAA